MSFVDIDSPGQRNGLEQGHEWLSEQGPGPGEWPEPNVRPPLLVKVTLCRVLYTTVVCVFGTWKAVAAYQGKAISSNTLDIFMGIILAVLIYWLGLFETVNPPVLTWFFHKDYAVTLYALFASRASSHRSVEMRALHIPATTAFDLMQSSDNTLESEMTEQDISTSELVRLLPIGSSISTQLQTRMEEVRSTSGFTDDPISSSNRPSESILTHRSQGKAITAIPKSNSFEALHSASTSIGSELPDEDTLKRITGVPHPFWLRTMVIKDAAEAQNLMDLYFPLHTVPPSTRHLLDSPEKFTVPARPPGTARWLFGCEVARDFIPNYWDNEDGLKHIRDTGVLFEPNVVIGHMRYRTGIRSIQSVVREPGIYKRKVYEWKCLIIVRDTQSAASDTTLTVAQMEKFVGFFGQPLSSLMWFWARRCGW